MRPEGLFFFFKDGSLLVLLVPGSHLASFTRPQHNTDRVWTVALGDQWRQTGKYINIH